MNNNNTTDLLSYAYLLDRYDYYYYYNIIEESNYTHDNQKVEQKYCL